LKNGKCDSDPAKPRQELQGLDATAKLRVCAYCRVWADNEEQLSSYEAQVSHYTDYIKRNPEWTYGGIFADECISGKPKHNLRILTTFM